MGESFNNCINTVQSQSHTGSGEDGVKTIHPFLKSLPGSILRYLAEANFVA